MTKTAIDNVKSRAFPLIVNDFILMMFWDLTDVRDRIGGGQPLIQIR